MREERTEKERVDRVLAPRIKRWRHMLEDMKFIEVRMEISRYFAITVDGKSFEDVLKELQDAKSKGCNTLYIEGLLDRILVARIRFEWGNEVAAKVSDCLFVQPSIK